MIKNLLFILFQKTSLLLSGTGLAKNERFYMVYRKFLSRLKPTTVTTEGSKMILDANDSLLLSIYPNFEPGETKIIKKYVKSGMNAVDAGANIGYFTLLMAKIVGEKGTVHAFEPDNANFKLMQKNVKLNNYRNVRMNESAVSDKNGHLTFYLSASNPQDHRIIEDSAEKRDTYKVPSVTLDSYFQKKKLDFIKMDIQGAELMALEGGERLLKSQKPILVLEYWPYGIYQAGRKPQEFFTFLEKNEYHIQQIDQKSGALKPIKKNLLLSASDPLDIFNFYCT